MVNAEDDSDYEKKEYYELMMMPKIVMMIILSKIMITKMKRGTIQSGLVVIIAVKLMIMMMMITMTKLIAIMVSGLAGVRIQRRCSGTLRFAIRELTRH